MRKFKKLLEDSIEQMDAIDKETEWSAIEPQWWLIMMEVRKTHRDALTAIKKKYDQ